MSVAISWTPTALAADFGRTVVQRFQETALPRYPSSGWFDVMYAMTEAVDSWTDLEARFGVEEQYRILVEDVDGIRSVPSAPDAVTVAGPGDSWLFTSNIDPTIDTRVQFPAVDVDLPERVAVHHVEGRFGYKLWRSSVELGERWSFSIDLLDEEGPELWRELVAALRRPVPYIAAIDGDGHRWLAGITTGGTSSPKHNRATLPTTLVEVATTPAPVVVP